MYQKTAQSGFAQFLLIILLLIGIAVGVYLLKDTQIFQSKASADPIVVTDPSGNTLPEENGLPVTTSGDVKLEFNPPTNP